MLTLQDIERARARIKDDIYMSPCAHSETFSKLTGNKVYFKLENLQMTGSFKERGALNKILTLTPEEKARGVIAASAGNHAQGVAYHATRNGMRCDHRHAGGDAARQGHAHARVRRRGRAARRQLRRGVRGGVAPARGRGRSRSSTPSTTTR